jgi:enoyl-[acyl-carrier protein] reductase I
MTDLSGKHGLIVGVANKRSISWAIAQALSKAGVRLALTYPSARLEENVRDLAASLENPLLLPCDVSNDQQIAELGAALDKEFGGLDFLVHGAAFARPESTRRSRRLRGRLSHRLDVSAYSIALARETRPLMQKRGGGSMLTLTPSAASGVQELQRHGRGEGGTGSVRAGTRR